MKPSDSQPGEAPALLISSNGVIISAREDICSALGWTREELANKSMSDLLEYGADLLMDQLKQSAMMPDSPESFSVSALVRRQDWSHFPATVFVRRTPELGGFTVAFEDLPTDVAEASKLQTSNEAHLETASISQAGGLRLVTGAVDAADAAPALRVSANNILAEQPSEVEPQRPANGNGPRFRNVFLNGLKPTDGEPKNGDNNGNCKESKDDFAKQLETERQERRRLEARVVSLNDQLQQLHVQLKNNLESESVYQKRVSEYEEQLQKAEESKAASETALREQQQQRERLEEDFAQLKTNCVQWVAERNSWQQEWLSKLESSLTALQESDVRLSEEIMARRELHETLLILQQDFHAHARRQSPNFPPPEPKDDVVCDSSDHPPLAEGRMRISEEMKLEV